MIITTQEATYARLIHDGVTYVAHQLGEAGNAIAITFTGSDTASGMSMSLSGTIVTISYETAGGLTIANYTQHDVKQAHNNGPQDVKDLIHITVESESTALATETTSNLSGGQEQIVTDSRGVYGGMTETELLDLRTKLTQALSANTTGTQVISVSIAGKQVTKKLPEIPEIRAELIQVGVALARLNPQKYGKTRRRFLMDHSRRNA